MRYAMRRGMRHETLYKCQRRQVLGSQVAVVVERMELVAKWPTAASVATAARADRRVASVLAHSYLLLNRLGPTIGYKIL